LGAFTKSEPEMTTTRKVAVKKMEVITTAYYKPLANQSRYATGSFRGDIRLNGSGKITSSGKKPRAGITVSADPRVLPMGTIICVPNFGVGVVEDTGGSIKGNKLDLFMGEGEEALKKSISWGRKKLTIDVIDHSEKLTKYR